ncbi:hypothetical protein ANO11243_082020 [Dothideomycetidae sp. 11243]|nr:hypothetical protein ANO11243_082020 [fungal sp. No.11243]
MPHYLHPRSRSTSTLFTGCLAVSFLVVGIPHLLPCPADRRQFVESEDGTPQTRRRRKRTEASQIGEEMAASSPTTQRTSTNQCPVPKPRGFIGQILGFKEETNKVEVIVKLVPARRRDHYEETP